jgi:alcohol dehydrogenase class IV
VTAAEAATPATAEGAAPAAPGTAQATGLADRLLVAAPTGRLEFGVGAVRRLAAAVAELGAARAFVVSDPGLAAGGVLGEVTGLLQAGGVDVETYDAVTPNPTTATLDDAAARARVFTAASDGAARPAVVAVGGGAVLDAAKGVAVLAANPLAAADVAGGVPLETDGLPVVAVPTTAGTGSETNGFGVVGDAAARGKVYVGHPSVQPRVCVLDPALTVGLPPVATAASGYDAFVHATESLTSPQATPLSQAYAREALRLVPGWLPAAVADGADLEARSHLLLGAHLAGRALSLSGLGLVHGLAHALSARYGTAHGVALAAVCGRVLAYNAETRDAAYADAARDVRVDTGAGPQGADAGAFVAYADRLATDVGLVPGLGPLGVEAEHVADLAATALADPVTANNPRTPSAADVEGLLHAAL